MPAGSPALISVFNPMAMDEWVVGCGIEESRIDGFACDSRIEGKILADGGIVVGCGYRFYHGKTVCLNRNIQRFGLLSQY